MNRDDRIQRQEQDPGTPDDTVHILPREWRDGEKSHHCTDTYHDDADCPRLQAQPTTAVTRDTAQGRWLKPCGNCVLGAEPSGKPGDRGGRSELSGSNINAALERLAADGGDA